LNLERYGVGLDAEKEGKAMRRGMNGMSYKSVIYERHYLIICSWARPFEEGYRFVAQGP